MNVRFIRNKLKAVAVSGGDDALVAAFFAGGGKGAENIVRLIALAGNEPVAQQPQQLLEYRHLAGQLGRHALSGRLVALIRPVAEGGRLQIEGDGDRVGAFFLFNFTQHGQKTVDRVGKLPFLVGQRADPVKRAIDDAVTVYNQQPHSLYITSVITPFL